jgi:TetR/AcrR family transcriptional regulator, regulator of cefoperazone and chloramphenicol sensitivity
LKTRASPRPSRMKAGKDTSALLIEAGIALFGARGYDGVTTRELADGARTNISSIKYHFGGKEALYRAVLEEIIHEITELVGPLLLALRNGVAEANGNRDVLTRLARQFAQNWCRAALGDPRTQKRIPPIVREVIQPSRHFTVIYNGFFRVLYDVLGELLAAAHGQAAAVDEELQIRTHIIMNMVWGFIFTESIFWHRMGWKGYNRKRIEAIVPVLADAFVLSIGLATKPAGDVQGQIAERG